MSTHASRIRKFVQLAALVAVVGALAVACGGENPMNGGNGDDGNDGTPSVEPDFLVGDNYFEDREGRRNTDASVEVTLGDTVRWEWVGSNGHNVTSGEGQGGASGDGVPSNGANVGSSTKSSGTFEFVPEATGTWEFYCTVHPSQMYGATFTVTSGSSSSVSSDRLGAADLEPGDVISPDDSHIVFIYRGKEGKRAGGE